MTKQLLFYERAVPVSADRHREFAVDSPHRYSFAAGVNAVPVVIGEFAKLSREYPIVFSEAGGAYQPLALCGLRDDENLFVDKDGTWDAAYIPAFVRRYPYIFHKHEENFVLCIDEGFDGINTEGKGLKLFDGKGEATDYLKQMLDFTTSYQKEVQLTAAFTAKLAKLEVLRQAQITFPIGGEQMAATRGLLTVDQEALHALSGAAVEPLLQSGELAHLYAHLLSLQNVDVLGARLRGRMAN